MGLGITIAEGFEKYIAKPFTAAKNNKVVRYVLDMDNIQSAGGEHIAKYAKDHKIGKF